MVLLEWLIPLVLIIALLVLGVIAAIIIKLILVYMVSALAFRHLIRFKVNSSMYTLLQHTRTVSVSGLKCGACTDSDWIARWIASVSWF